MPRGSRVLKNLRRRIFNNNCMTTKEFLLAGCLIFFAVAGRLLPHLPDATPLTAVILASALYLRPQAAFLVPLSAVLLSDLMLGFYDLPLMATVYGSWALIGAMSLLARRYPGARSAALVTLSASTLFFFTTNTAVWAFSPWYPHTFAGLLQCLELGLPFWRNMLLGDAIYVPVLLGAFSALRVPFFRGKVRVSYAN